MQTAKPLFKKEPCDRDAMPAMLRFFNPVCVELLELPLSHARASLWSAPFAILGANERPPRILFGCPRRFLLGLCPRQKFTTKSAAVSETDVIYRRLTFTV